MSQSKSVAVGTVSLDQLIALTEEIAAMVRAGVPLDQGLTDLGDDVPGRLGRMAAALGHDIKAGKSLSAAMEKHAGSFPPLYRAVVAAGLRSGRLATALEGIATTARRLAYLRRTILLALFYPLLVVALGYGVLVATVVFWIPDLLDFYRDFQFPTFGVGSWLLAARETAQWWAPVPPLLVAVALPVWWYRTQRPSSAGFSGRRSWFRRWPTVGGVLYEGRLAALAESLALLVEHQVALDEALVLAGQASGDRSLELATGEMAQRIGRGEAPVAAGHLPRGLPATLSWLLMSGLQQGRLPAALRQAAERHHQQTRRMTDWLTRYLPMILSVAIGGSMLALLAAVLLGPYIYVIYRLSAP